MKTFTIILAIILFTTGVCAQATFYEQLKANGSDALYTTFYSENYDSGVYTPGKQGDEIKIKLMGFARMTVGFEASNSETGEYLFGANESTNSGSRDQYPITKMVKHKDENLAYAMIEGSLFKFKVGKDGILKPENLLEVYVLNGKKGSSQNTEASTPKVKKKKKGFFKNLKSLGQTKAKSSNRTQEKNYLKGLDIKKLVTYFESTMAAKQKSYKLTTEEKVVRAKLEDLQKDREGFIKRYNDAIYYSPKEVENRRKWAIINGGTSLSVKNNTSTTIWVSSSIDNFSNTKINSGGEGAADCRSDLYYFLSDKKGATGVKFYTANSACGSSATVN